MRKVRSFLRDKKPRATKMFFKKKNKKLKGTDLEKKTGGFKNSPSANTLPPNSPTERANKTPIDTSFVFFEDK